MQVELTGRFHHYTEFKDDLIDPDELQEGDILIQPKLDARGRMAVKGGNANYGYSGYFGGFLYADGNARRFLKWVDLWPIGENTFEAQKDKHSAIEAMQHAITRLAGCKMIKVNGGWQLEHEVNEILERKG